MRHGTGPFLIQQPALRRLLPNTSASKRLCKDALPNSDAALIRGVASIGAALKAIQPFLCMGDEFL